MHVTTFCLQNIIDFIAVIVVVTSLQIGTSFTDIVVMRCSYLNVFGSRKYLQPGRNEVVIIPRTDVMMNSRRYIFIFEEVISVHYFVLCTDSGFGGN
jgi:hypothetical protein